LINEEIVKTDEEMKFLLDKFMNSRPREWWDSFYSNKDRNIPFYISAPDENLIQYIETGEIKTGKALDIGCGNGRNSLFLAKNGFDVIGLDFSLESINYAKKNHAHENIEYRNLSFFDFNHEKDNFDFIYDGGCLHHISPHRRPDYLKKVKGLLKIDGKYGMEIFNEKGGADLTDYQVYEERSMKGGLAFSKTKLNEILSEYFDIIELREMREITDDTAFGKSFCWTVLMKNI